MLQAGKIIKGSGRKAGIIAAQMRLLHRAARASVPINILSSIIVTALCWPFVDNTYLMVWTGFIIVISILRLALCFTFLSRKKIHDFRPWITVFLIGSALTGGAWGGLLFLFPEGEANPQLLMVGLFFIAGMTAGSTSSTNVYLPANIAFNAPAILPTVLFFALLGGYINYALSFAMVAYFLLLTRNGIASSRSIKELLIQRQIIRHQSKNLKAQKVLLQNVLDTIDIGVVVFDRNLKLSLWNRALKSLLGMQEDWLTARPSIEDFIRRNAEHGEFGEGNVEDIVQAMLKRYEDPNSIKAYRHERTQKMGTRMEVMASPMSAGGLVATYTDVTERFHRLEKIRILADHDSLTGLVNRPVFERRLRRAVASAKRSGRMVSIYYMDLDHFKDVNDNLGHPVGDQLLRQVADRLMTTARETDTVARLGGDEFAIIGTNHKTVKDVSRFAERIIEVISKPYTVGNNVVHTGASIGATIYPDDRSTPVELFSHADMALYKAKESGRDQFALFDSKMNDELKDRKKTEIELRLALERDELALFYQPQIDLKTQKIIGAEALLRWQHKDRGLIPPDNFLPIAESTRLINPIGEWVIDEACSFVKKMEERGHRDFKVSVNLSPVQFRSEDLLEKITGIMERYGVLGHQIEIEITESTVITNVEEAIKTLGRFQSLGISIAIDDFGIGYSSMAYLKDFSANILKIDKSFVLESLSHSDNAKIISGIIQLGHSLGMDIVAEGVEDHEQEILLKSMGCDFGQGYYYARPMPEMAFQVFLADHKTV